MKQTAIILLILLLSGRALHAQQTCEECEQYHADIQSGTTLMQKGEYENALTEFQAAQVAARVCGCSTQEAAELISTSFQGMQKQRDEARLARFKAEQKEKEVEAARKQTQKALEQAERTARANQPALLALRKNQTDPTMALNMAWLNKRLYPKSATAAGIFAEIISDRSVRASMITARGHTSYVSDIRFSPSGNYILTGSLDITARLRDLQGQELQVLRGHTSYVSDVRFSPDGNYILTASGDNTARLWDLPDSYLTECLHLLQTGRLYGEGIRWVKDEIPQMLEREDSIRIATATYVEQLRKRNRNSLGTAYVHTLLLENSYVDKLDKNLFRKLKTALELEIAGLGLIKQGDSTMGKELLTMSLAKEVRFWPLWNLSWPEVDTINFEAYLNNPIELFKATKAFVNRKIYQKAY